MRCPACGESNPERAKFCLECGTSLAAARAAAEERRTVTVVFADMVGSTALGESLDGESLRRVVDRYYEEMRAAVAAQGGTVAKFIGDAVMAVWGTPTVREDDALRAVRAAAGMRRALAALNEDLGERWGVCLGVRIGVNTGEVVVDPQRPADLLVGDTLNTAARLEQAARDGEILVGPETNRLVRGELALEPVAPLELRGKARPLHAWRLLDDAERAPVAGAAAPLVGREREMARIRAAFDEAVAARAFRLVTVIGSPGVGKSRLTQELAASLVIRGRTVVGRCAPTGESAALEPIAEIVRAGAGVEDADEPDVIVARLNAIVQRGAICEHLAGLLGLAPPVSAEETFWAVRRFLEALGARRPLIVVVEDLHWAQPALLDLVEHLAEWGRDAPVLIIALARPELRDLRPELARTGRLVAAEIDLQPLDPQAGRELIDRLLGTADLPPALAARVLETTEGNPLFLGETVRMLVDDGVLRHDGERWVATGDGVTVPPSINAVLAARLQRLSAGERAVLERAAVIGPQFPSAAVAELVGRPVEAELAALRRKELVRPTDDGYRFDHLLIRDAAYRSLLKEARAELHERFAGWLETHAADQDALIAFHLEQGFRYREQLGPLGVGGRTLGARAADRLRAAGLHALEREDLPAAADLLRRALGPLEGDHPLRALVLADLGETLASAGDIAQAEWVIEELALRADEAGDARLRARATALGGQLANLTGGAARDTLLVVGVAARRLAVLGDAAGEARAHQVCAGAHALLGQVGAAEAALDRALVAARRAGDRRRITSVLANAPRAALWGPSPVVRASGRCLDVVRILRLTPGNRHVEAAALRCQAVLEAMRGRHEAARGILAGCRAVLEELGLTLELHETAVHAGIVELLAGDAVAAERALSGARDGYLALGADAGAAQAAALLARALLAQGREDDALVETGFAEDRGGEDLKTTIAWLGARAEALARRGNHDEALALAERAVVLADPTDALSDKADAHMALAAVLRAAGRPDDAATETARAHELYAAKGYAGDEAAIAGGEDVAVCESARPPIAQPVLEFLRTFVGAVNARDYDWLLAGFAETARMVDRRSVGWEEVRGGGAVVDLMRQTVALAPDVRMRSEVLAGWQRGDVGVWASLASYAGTEAEHGTRFEVRFGSLGVTRGGRTVLNELLPDDRDAVLRRFDELVGEQAHEAPAARAYARWTALLNARDWPAIEAALTPDTVLHDVRTVAAGDIAEGRAAVLAEMRSILCSAPDMRHEVDDVLCADTATVALTGAWRRSGRAPGALAGSMEVPLSCVAVFDESGGLRRMEVYDVDARERCLARYDELHGTGPPVPSAAWPPRTSNA